MHRFLHWSSGLKSAFWCGVLPLEYVFFLGFLLFARQLGGLEGRCSILLSYRRM